MPTPSYLIRKPIIGPLPQSSIALHQCPPPWPQQLFEEPQPALSPPLTKQPHPHPPTPPVLITTTNHICQIIFFQPTPPPLLLHQNKLHHPTTTNKNILHG